MEVPLLDWTGIGSGAISHSNRKPKLSVPELKITMRAFYVDRVHSPYSDTIAEKHLFFVLKSPGRKSPMDIVKIVVLYAMPPYWQPCFAPRDDSFLIQLFSDNSPCAQVL